MNGNTINISDKLVQEQLQSIADNKLRPIMAGIAQAHARIKVEQENLANLLKQANAVKAEITEVHASLTKAFEGTTVVVPPLA